LKPLSGKLEEASKGTLGKEISDLTRSRDGGAKRVGLPVINFERKKNVREKGQKAPGRKGSTGRMVKTFH